MPTATDYIFELDSGNLKVTITDEPGPINTWSSSPFNNCLIIESGRLIAKPDGFYCQHNFDIILLLKGANWDTKVDCDGVVSQYAGHGCNPKKWTLIEINERSL